MKTNRKAVENPDSKIPRGASQNSIKEIGERSPGANSIGVRGSKQENVDPPKKPTSHLLLRVRSEGGLTIDAHQKMVARYGLALFGKIGDPLGSEFQECLNSQIANGQRTYLFIVARPDINHPFETFRCPLRQVCNTLNSAKKHLVPGYYVGEASRIGSWFEIEGMERLGRDEVNSIFILKSGRLASESLYGQNAVFRVGIRDPHA
jgi:hypothetical protein